MALLLAGCRVEATVDVDVDGQGGSVTARFVLDREAAELLGDDFEDNARVDDLRRAGWTVGPLRRRASGAVAELSKRFERPGDLAGVIGELSGPDGPLQDFSLSRRRGLTGSVQYRLRGRLAWPDDGAAITGFDAGGRLAERAQAAGVDPERVRRLLAGRAEDGLEVKVTASLPGREGAASWPLAPGQERSVSASSSVRAWSRIALLAAAVGLAAAAVIVARQGRRRA